ncbi:uncharacterized protein [Leptinotarsa decemlineata]|uniref:uncharacterized protein n=1 Tax=Leptinotarsa decemlineata TaxID=7539 RepID=UPI003D309D87
MAKELSVVQFALIEQIAHQNGFDVFDLEVSSGSEKGDNYLGIITRVTVKDEKRKIELILKSASTNDAFRRSAPVHKLFCREIHIYDKIFPAFQMFQKEFNIPDPFLGHAKLYGKSQKNGNECLIMENLIESGYSMWNRKQPMDSAHILAVLCEYAKFHATSLAYRHKRPEAFAELTKDIQHHVLKEEMENRKKMESYSNAAVANGLKAVSDDPAAVEVLERLQAELPDYLMAILRNPELNILVNHGDNWCNNIMFKYEDPKNILKPSKVALLDWQISKMGSPGADLSYFFLSHSPKEILYNYKNYLNLYYDCVSKNLKDFSCDPEKVFPRSLLERHWRIFVKFGFYISLIIVNIMCCDKEEAPDLDEIDAKSDFIEALATKMTNSSEYNRRIKDLLQFLIDEKLLDAEEVSNNNEIIE